MLLRVFLFPGVCFLVIARLENGQSEACSPTGAVFGQLGANGLLLAQRVSLCCSNWVPEAPKRETDKTSRVPNSPLLNGQQRLEIWSFVPPEAPHSSLPIRFTRRKWLPTALCWPSETQMKQACNTFSRVEVASMKARQETRRKRRLCTKEQHLLKSDA